jgi:hypothetical protein
MIALFAEGVEVDLSFDVILIHYRILIRVLLIDSFT